MRQRAKHRLRSAEAFSVPLHELHRAVVIFTCDLRKSGALFLRGNIFNLCRRRLSPALDPAAAEMAIAIEEHYRLRRRIGHATRRISAHQLQGSTSEVQRPP